MQVRASSPSSNPAQASIKSPSVQPFTNVGNRNCRISTTVERSTLNVKQQQHRAIAPIIGLPALPLPTAVAASIFEGRLLQDVPVVREQAFFDNTHSIARP